jgi:hypothetical protein
VIWEIFVSARAEQSIDTNEAGIESDCNDVQSQNASDAIRDNFAPSSNVNDERDLQPKKDLESITSTDSGIAIDSNDKQPEKASAPILPNWDSDSKVNDESCSH